MTTLMNGLGILAIIMNALLVPINLMTGDYSSALFSALLTGALLYLFRI